MTTYAIEQRNPTICEYMHLRANTGLTFKDAVAVERGLSGSLFAVCAVREGATVGMGRVVGDGGVCFDIVDVAVLLAHQKRGVGHLIMTALMRYIHETARPTAWVNLMAGPGVAPFYERYGFEIRGPERPGMSFMVGSSSVPRGPRVSRP